MPTHSTFKILNWFASFTCSAAARKRPTPHPVVSPFTRTHTAYASSPARAVRLALWPCNTAITSFGMSHAPYSHVPHAAPPAHPVYLAGGPPPVVATYNASSALQSMDPVPPVQPKPLPQPPVDAQPSANQAAALLHSLQSALNSQLAHLPGLHATLGLPGNALAGDLELLRVELLATAEGCVKRRQEEVDAWHARCTDVDKSCVGLSKALGSHVRSLGVASIGEIGKVQVLPRRLELLETHRAGLMRVC